METALSFEESIGTDVKERFNVSNQVPPDGKVVFAGIDIAERESGGGRGADNELGVDVIEG